MSDTPPPSNTDHPNVRIPPPLIFVGGLALGLLLPGNNLSLAVLPLTPARIAALLFVALWGVLGVWSVTLFRRVRTSFIPVRPTTALVVSGPYRFTRNPLYLALVCLYLGVALWLGIFAALAFLPVVIVVIHFYVIAREEHYLERKFGQDYLNYKARVRRWL